MNAFRKMLLRWLGGVPASEAVQRIPSERKVFVAFEKVAYEGLGRPFDLGDWEKLATMYSWGEVFFRFLAFQLRDLDEEERNLGYGVEKDRDRLSIGVRRAVFKDLQRIHDTAAAKVTAAYQKAEDDFREKGLSNNGH